jgi:hypothetical protein
MVAPGCVREGGVGRIVPAQEAGVGDARARVDGGDRDFVGGGDG